MTDDYTLTRTGLPPLRFAGEEVASASSHRHDGPGQNRWHEATIYRTEGGSYVVAVAYRSLWQGEDARHWAAAFREPAAVVDAIRAIDPLEAVVGYPRGEAYAEKQSRLEADLRGRWATLVSELYEQLGGDFAERVE